MDKPIQKQVRWGLINVTSTGICAFSWVPLEIFSRYQAIPMSVFVLWTVTTWFGVLCGQRIAWDR